MFWKQKREIVVTAHHPNTLTRHVTNIQKPVCINQALPTSHAAQQLSNHSRERVALKEESYQAPVSNLTRIYLRQNHLLGADIFISGV